MDGLELQAKRMEARPRMLLVAVLLAGLLAGVLAASAHGEASWPTYHRDAARSGADPDAVNPITPMLSWQSPDLGAPIWSQPLILGSRVYVATLANQIYALDATTGKVIWEQNGGTPVPEGASECQPEVGIVGTPVIDTSTGILYAVADTWDAATEEAHHILEGYKIAGGERVLSTPVDPPGANPKTLLERPALNLADGEVVFGFGGNPGDCGVYNGAVVAAPENGAAPSFWQYAPAPPAFGGGAVWGASGAAVDGEGHIYIGTGNPNFPEETEVTSYDYSDSLVELDSSMSLIGHFAPETWLSDSNNDRDLSSSGPELLPGGLLFQAGKNEIGYLIDESTMGTGASPVYSQKVCKGVKAEGEGEGSFGGDAYADGTIYVPCIDGVRALTFNQTARTFKPLWQGPADAIGPPIVSGGLVWVLSGKFLKGEGTKLYGLDPTTGLPLYTETLPSPTADHFASPSAAGGRVFVATGSSITAYQIAELLPNQPTLATDPASSPTQTSATLNATVDPNGGSVGECRFEYGPTISYGSSVACTSLPGSGETPVAVSAQLHGLLANSSYHDRIVASNRGGTSFGDDRTFSTLPDPPAVVTDAASSVGQSIATLNASVDANGATITDCHFEYGPTPSLGSVAPCTQTPAKDAGAVAVSVPISGLAAATSYYFRILAANAGGVSPGALQTLKTLEATSVHTTPTPTPTTPLPTLSPPLQGLGAQGVLGSREEKSPSILAARLAGTSLTVNHARTLNLKIDCPGNGPCTGTVTLWSLPASPSRRHQGKQPGSITLAVGSFRLTGGQQATLKLHLTAAAQKLLAHSHRLRVRATIATRNPAGATLTTQAIVRLHTL